jgi:glycosyltransferase involved in cell wall biosynthesis
VYARCDIPILPANFSNGKFTILEAMASGLGVVVSDHVLGIGKMVDEIWLQLRTHDRGIPGSDRALYSATRTV